MKTCKEEYRKVEKTQRQSESLHAQQSQREAGSDSHFAKPSLSPQGYAWPAQGWPGSEPTHSQAAAFSSQGPQPPPLPVVVQVPQQQGLAEMKEKQ